MIDRRQQKEQIVLIPAYCFSVTPGADVEMQSLESVLSVPFHIIYENTSDVWINVSQVKMIEITLHQIFSKPLISRFPSTAFLFSICSIFVYL